MIPFGPFHPDSAGVNSKSVLRAANVVPGAAGFTPFNTMVPISQALPLECRGVVSALKDDGHNKTFAGTQDKLFLLSSSGGWVDVSRLAGGAYNTGSGERWKFDLYGDRLIAVNGADDPQSIDVATGANFSALSAAAPVARQIAVVREFVVLGGVLNNEKRVQWSANGDATEWTPGVRESDFQDIPNGGPVRGLIGGETGYIFQASKVTRMTYAAGSPLIFQFDEVEGAAGLTAPHSLLKLRSSAYYLAQDGFREFGLSSAGSRPIGVNKWVKWFLADMKPGTETFVTGAANPVRPVIIWSYVSKENATQTPNRLLIYDWSIDEATFADLSVEALTQWLSPGVNLDAMAPYGTLDTLPFSLDSAVWKGGASSFAVIGTDHRLSLTTGTPMAATIVTGDGQLEGRRVIVNGTAPLINASGLTVEIAARERVQDDVVFNAAEALEDTGVVPAHASGNIIRARINIPAESWSLAQGIRTLAAPQGGR